MSCQLPEESRPSRRRSDATRADTRGQHVTPRDDLAHLPALILLDRLPIPTLALGCDGEFLYANPAAATMLGYPEVSDMTDRALSTLMAGHVGSSAPDCVAALRAAVGTVTDWCHADGYRIHAVVSAPLLTRETDSVLLIMLMDVTDMLWGTRA